MHAHHQDSRSKHVLTLVAVTVIACIGFAQLRDARGSEIGQLRKMVEGLQRQVDALQQARHQAAPAVVPGAPQQLAAGAAAPRAAPPPAPVAGLAKLAALAKGQPTAVATPGWVRGPQGVWPPPGTVAEKQCAASLLRPVTLGDAALDARAQASSGVGGMAPSQYRVIMREIIRLRPTNLIVFSVGGDTALWRELNGGGTSVFFEDVPEWAAKVREMTPGADIRMLTYKTNPNQCKSDAGILGGADLARARSAVAMYDLTDARRKLGDVPWRIIHVDGPAGFTRGRIQSALMGILIACSVARTHGGSVTLFFHDAERPCENEISRQLFSARVVECQRWPYSERTAKGEYSPQPNITLHRYEITADHDSCKKPQFALSDGLTHP